MSSYNRKDRYYQKAKDEGYVARSAYKIKELDKRFGIFKPDTKLVDLGCAPGGWLQIACEALKNKSARIVGIDLEKITLPLPDFVTTIQGDFLEETNQQKILETLAGKVDWVISDLSPHLTGIKFSDLASSMNLAEVAFSFSQKILKPGGSLIIKIFPGPEFALFKKKLKIHFKRVEEIILDSTRKTSNEVYVVGIHLLSSHTLASGGQALP